VYSQGHDARLGSPGDIPPAAIAVAATAVAIGGGATQLSINIFTDAQENMKLYTVKPRTTYMPVVCTRWGSERSRKRNARGYRTEYWHSATIKWNNRIHLYF